MQALLDGGDAEAEDAAGGGSGEGVDAEARAVFDRFDADRSGTIEAGELEAALVQLVGLSAGLGGPISLPVPPETGLLSRSRRLLDLGTWMY